MSRRYITKARKLKRRYLQPFGLRWSRLKDFREVLVSEGESQGWWNVTKKITGSVVMIISNRKLAPNREEIRGRYRYCLQKCAITPRKYNSQTKRFEGKGVCRNGIAGCGCLLAYKVTTPDACWGWPYGFGWAISLALKAWRAIHGSDEESSD